MFLLATLLVHGSGESVVNPKATWGVWEGWGTSLAWFGNVFGDRNDVADALFTLQPNVTIGGYSVPGLGFTIVRYNAGGSGAGMVQSKNMPNWKAIQGYWLNWDSADPTSKSWDWNVDDKQRQLVKKALARGTTHVELFSNSPMWWMCINHNPSGADVATNDNLQSWNYEQFALYLATIVSEGKKRWNITFTSVDPFNEPSSNYWHKDGTQEGCHFEVSTMEKVVSYLSSHLQALGVSGQTIIAAADETSTTQAINSFTKFNAATKNILAKVNVHGYEYENGRRDILYNDVSSARKILWNSEYGEGDETGRRLMINLNFDFKWLHPTAWCYWQPFDGVGWGLWVSNPGDNWIGAPNRKWWIMAHYSRHIRANMTIISVDNDDNSVAALDLQRGKLVIVTANYDNPQTVNYDLSAFTELGTRIDIWTTETAGSTVYVHSTDSLSSKHFSRSLAKNSIQTIEISGVKL